MKKILIFIILINILTLNSFSVEITDCSKYSKLSTEYYKCKTDNLIKDTKNYTDNFIKDIDTYVANLNLNMKSQTRMKNAFTGNLMRLDRGDLSAEQRRVDAYEQKIYHLFNLRVTLAPMELN